MTLVTLNAKELLVIIQHSVAGIAPGATPGSFPQIAGLAFSFDPDLPAGKRVKSLAIKDGKGKIIDVVVKNAELVGDSNRIFRAVTLNFLANGGDGYPFPKRERVDLIRTYARVTENEPQRAQRSRRNESLRGFLRKSY
ncbi:5'-nucleotidase C-terminal domain-containing protein [Nostoc sp. ChiSLP03a]|uniref:5'-nucleotidase C-terminal domain-containing protein n=1 Tax=Nostoc sp. ChiSLP03a TaxID=3075380 RepID=UPI002AD215EA|nr:5'-nucleotidase C-terminal domain-containing protein [Nostoc sp. ChiSLP03a]MDZ8213984.1 5'-nucleotidase C-terminal domain-containing protein [Nostoc sp. ChiSLP03a]